MTENKGKIEITSKVSLETIGDLSIHYTPGVAGPCRRIFENPEAAYDLTPKGNMVAVVTDGSAVLGLGNIGALAGYPVMEGKSLLFKKFAGIDAVPICIDTQDTEELIRTIKAISPQFGGINLEDISAPRCFEIERRLDEELSIPVFHDDQYGTAIVVLAGLINALKIVPKESPRIVVSGAGAAGLAISKLLAAYGLDRITICDSKGVLSGDREDLNEYKKELAASENGTLADAVSGADIFIGVSAPGIVSKEMVESMAADPIVFALANPDPEIDPEAAKEAGASVVATGRSDYPNQVNNALVFPGIFRGALDNRVPSITHEMKIAAAEALAALIDSPTAERIIPNIFDEGVVPSISEAVSKSVVNNQ